MCVIILNSQIYDTPIMPISCFTTCPNSSQNNGTLIALGDLAGFAYSDYVIVVLTIHIPELHKFK